MCLPWLSLLALSAVLHAELFVLGATVSASTNAPLSDAYAPNEVPCPAESLTRPADGISASEREYISARKAIADEALASWLQRTSSQFQIPSELPMLAMAHSGGGFRAMLTGAGVIQAMDARDSETSMSGLYQALSYQSGLSGGSWLLGSLADNDWPTVSQIRAHMWDRTIPTGILNPGGIASAFNDLGIDKNVASKSLAGFQTSIVDYWGRLQGYTFFEQKDGGVSSTLSGLTAKKNFTQHKVPFPVITSILVDSEGASCPFVLNATQFELTPYEFGSWDKRIASFQQSKYIGSRDGKCITGYDRLGYVLGTSSNVFTVFCIVDVSTALLNAVQSIVDVVSALTKTAASAVNQGLFALYPNPFDSSPDPLTLADGGFSGQAIPIWPFLHRDIDVLFVQDSNNDLPSNFPNGTQIHDTYLQAQANGLMRMPAVPSSETFLAKGFNTKPTFFGCNTLDTLTVLYIPNYNFTFQSGVNDLLSSTAENVAGLVSNGHAIATYNGSNAFATCVGCAILKKRASELPAVCKECFDEFCYN